MRSVVDIVTWVVDDDVWSVGVKGVHRYVVSSSIGALVGDGTAVGVDAIMAPVDDG